MERRIAQIVSYLFHPLLMPSWGSFLAFQIPPLSNVRFNTGFYAAFFIITFGFTFLLPAVNCYILLRSGNIKSMRMETKEERRLPLVITSVFYFSEYYLLNLNEGIPMVLKMLMLGATLCVIVTFMVNMFWKISAHMMGIGGLTGMMIGMSLGAQSGINMMLITVLLIAGIIGFARLRLEEHKPAQVYAGFLLGMLCEWGFLSLYLI